MSAKRTQQNLKTPIKNNEQSNQQLESTDNSDASNHCNGCDELQLKVRDLEKQVKRLQDRKNRMRNTIKKLPLQFQTKQALNDFYQVLNDVMSVFDQQRSKIDNDIMINYFSTQTQQLKELKEQLNKQDIQLPIALFLGQAGVGKTTLISSMIDKQEINEFELLQSIDTNYYFVDTPGFDFDNIDVREQQIAQYQNLFNSYGKNIRAIFIVVNFERTDIMKKKVNDIFKFFNKFKNLISIIITQFHLSQDKISDKQHLQQRFEHFKAKQLIFIDENNDHSQIINAIAPLSLDVRDTIFEPTNEEEQAEIMKDFLKQYK